LKDQLDTTASPVGTAEPPPPGCTIIGTEGNDMMQGTPGDDVICGLGGVDEINGWDGNDQIYGCEGGEDTEQCEAGRPIARIQVPTLAPIPIPRPGVNLQPTR
jgi:Ca2+-binding RTX toxin-like protein